MPKEKINPIMSKPGKEQNRYGNAVSPVNRTSMRIDRFQEWELRCRGWDIFPNRVDLEPQFEPFFLPLHITERYRNC